MERKRGGRERLQGSCWMQKERTLTRWRADELTSNSGSLGTNVAFRSRRLKW